MDVGINHFESEIVGLRAEVLDVVQRLDCFETDRNRLRDGPTPGDESLVYGQVCELAEDGSSVLPGPPPTTGPLEMPGADEIFVGGDLVAMLYQGAGERGMTRERVLEMARDQIRNALRVPVPPPRSRCRAANRRSI